MARILMLTTAQQLLLTLTNIIPGTARYAPQDDGCTVVPVDDTHALLIAGEAPCVSHVLVTADVDAQSVQELLIVHVHGAHAALLALTVSEPQPKTPLSPRRPSHPKRGSRRAS